MIDISWAGAAGTGVLAFVIVYVLGTLTIYVFDISSLSSWKRLFFTLLFGFLGVISLTSVYFTFFKSIFALFPATYFAYFIYTFHRSSKQFTENLKHITSFLKEDTARLAICIGFYLVFVLIQLIRYQYWQSEPMIFPDHDHSYYLNVGHYMTIIQSENSIPWYETFYQDKYYEPYHYSDVWLLAFLLKLYPFTDCLALFSYCFVPLIAALFACAGMTLIESTELFLENNLPVSENFRKHAITARPTDFLPVFIAIFIGGIIPFREGGYLDMVLYLPKMFPVYMCLSVFIIFIQSGQITPALISLLVLPVLNILYAPATLTATFIWTGILFLQKKNTVGFRHFLFIIAVAIYIAGFYYLTGYFNSFSYSFLLEKDNISFIFWLFDEVLDNIWLYHLFFACLLGIALAVFPKKILADGILIWTMLGLMTIVSWIQAYVFRNHTEAFQLPGLFINPILFNLFFIIYVAFVRLSLQKTIKNLAFGIMTVYGVIIFLSLFFNDYLNERFRHRLSSAFFEEVKKEFRVKNRIGAYVGIKGDNFFRNTPHLGSFFSTFFLQKLGKGYVCVSLDDMEKSPDQFTALEKEALYERDPFYRFLQEQKKEQKFISVETSRADFIRHFRIEYLVLEKGTTVPKDLQQHIQKEINDLHTGLKLIIFSPYTN